MGLLNYTTQISPEKTIAEIEKILADHGALKILKDYEAGKVVAISFMVETEKGMLPFKLPMNEDAVMQVINNQTKEYSKGRLVVPKKFYGDRDQARRVGWRIMKDWIEAQMAILELQMVKIDQVFLPYMQDNQGKTVYDKFVESNYKGYVLENHDGGGSDEL